MSKIASSEVVALALAISGGTAQAQTLIPPPPQDFAVAAAQSDQYEVMAGRLAEVQGQSPRVKAFAQKMIRDHTQMSEDIRRAAVASKMSPPPSACLAIRRRC
jgi:putative membrane protein